MAGPNKAMPANVVITLHNDDDNTVPFLKRTLLLDESKPTAPIGRASKVSSKGFIAAHDNAWFESAVMSRNHAEIVARFEEKKVYIRDIGSLHGTFVNTMQEGAIDKKLQESELQEITEGAKVTLGVPIVRNNEAFTPTSFRIRIAHGPRTRIANHNPTLGSTYSVPEFVDDSSSDDEDSKEDTEPAISPSPIEPKMSLARHQNVVDLTTEADNEPIDLTSPIRPLSPALPEDHHMNDELEDQPMSDNMASEPMHASAHATVAIVDDGSELSFNGSPSIPSYDDDEIDDDSDGGIDSTGSDSTSSMGEGIDWNSMRSKSVESGSDHSDDGLGSSVDNDSIADESDFGSHHGYDAEYSSDDDVIDEDDPDTAVWPEEPESPMPVLVQPFAVPLSLPPIRPNYVHAEPLSIPELMNPTTNEAVAEDMHEALAEGMRTTGRNSYFAACTENRTNSVPTPPLPQALPTPTALAASVGTPGDRPQGPGFPRCLNEFVVPAKEKATTQHSRMKGCWPAPGPGEDSRQELLAESKLLKSGDAFLADPHQLAATDMITRSGTPSNKADDEDDMPISAHDLREKKRIAYNLRFDEEASATTSAVRQHPLAQPRSGALKIADLLYYEAKALPVEASGVVAAAKGKRKSEEISTLTDKEMAWEASLLGKLTEAGATLASQQSLPSKDDSMVVDRPEEAHPTPSPAEVSAQIPAEALSVPAPPACRQEIRPAKRQRVRDIAERLGYAALGGVSVGAAIVTTLIYTAPTF